ncbi:CDGSH iron-sulfur domain-containing protein 3, mitochondrial-like [Salvelinus namaycush]|uniref:CDGSH iron-sulfur domain-containing protein 3, mitochondrial-like n=1 Tax=Salvelinus namaycush TaxID=8040 RepID=A0A8U0Q1F8_SALNM|nr:CDGSH iron-sulfur domain-containing protein 3, mitochondrial-like [Salvelinus namaycush]
MNVILGTMRNGTTATLRQSQLFAAVASSRMQCSTQTNKPVVAAKMPFRVKVTGGKRYVWCACGHSKKQPFCDGAHKTKAPSISPRHFTPEKDSTLMLCACKQTKNAPYCDGTHFKVIFRHLVSSVKKVFKMNNLKKMA